MGKRTRITNELTVKHGLQIRANFCELDEVKSVLAMGDDGTQGLRDLETE